MRALAPLLVVTLWVGGSPSAAMQPTGDTLELAADLRLRPYAEDLWLIESDSEWNGRTISANALIVVGDRRVVVIDTPWTESQTTMLLDWIEESIGLPVQAFVVTHAHGDRIGGIAEVHRRGIETYGHTTSVELAAENGFEHPRHTFSTRLELDVEGESLTLIYPGPGHTTDNIVVWLEDRGLLYGGCLIKSAASRGLGYIGDADLAAWPQTVAYLIELLPSGIEVVPGHGEPGGRELLETTRRLLAENAQRAQVEP